MGEPLGMSIDKLELYASFVCHCDRYHGLIMEVFVMQVLFLSRTKFSAMASNHHFLLGQQGILPKAHQPRNNNATQQTTAGANNPAASVMDANSQIQTQ